MTINVFTRPVGGLLEDTVRGNDNAIRAVVNDILGGYVVGPASSTDNALAVYDGITGQLLKDSALIVSGTTIPALTGVGTLVSGAIPVSLLTGDLPFASFVQASAASRLVGRGSASGAGDFQELTLGSGISLAGTVLSATGLGGDVVGPASSVDARIATFSGITGKLIQDSGTLISGLATASHTHTFASLTSIPTTIAGYGITDFNSLGDARWSLLAHTHAASALTGTTLAASVVTSSLTSVGTLSAGAVPASLVTAGTFGAGAYTFPSTLAITGALTGSLSGHITHATNPYWGLTKSNATSRTGYLEIYGNDLRLYYDGAVRLSFTETGAAAFSGPVTVGTTRPVVVSGANGSITIKGDTGGWATGYSFNGSAGTFKGGFGALGNADALTYYWIGADYNSATAMLVYPSGAVTMSSSLAITGALTGVTTLTATDIIGTTLGVGVAAAAGSARTATKTVTGLNDAAAITMLTVTVPNADHAAMVRITYLIRQGTGGGIGPYEAASSGIVTLVFTRRSGTVAAGGVSPYTARADAVVAGGGATGLVVTLGAVSGAAGAINTFAVLGQSNYLLSGTTASVAILEYEVLNADASGITVA